MWLDHLERLASPSGPVYRLRLNVSPRLEKAFLRGDALLVEEVHSDRDVHVSDRAGELVRPVRRRARDAVIDPATGAAGTSWELRNETDPQDPVLLLSWGC